MMIDLHRHVPHVRNDSLKSSQSIDTVSTNVEVMVEMNEKSEIWFQQINILLDFKFFQLGHCGDFESGISTFFSFRIWDWK